ncbi:MAG: hypothetical protein ACPG4U_16200 [Pseudomonadales bacterium]
MLVAVMAAALPLLYWFSAAAVSLVTLRKGEASGAQIAVWALLPTVFWAQRGDVTPMIVIAASYLLAVILRRSVSWQRVLQFAIVLTVLSGLGQQLFNADMIHVVVQETQKLMSQTSSEAGSYFAERSQWLFQATLGVFDALHLVMMLSSLFLARWWQARLFNPGGLQQEFHQLRFSPQFTTLLIAAAVVAQMSGGELVRWLPVIVLPLLIAGLALAHGSVAKKGLGRSWLVVLYLAAVLLGPYVITMLVVLATIDTFVDIRRRIPASH